MDCPYCKSEMEQGTMIIDEAGSVTFVYRSEEDSQKKGFLNRLKSNPLVMIKYRRDKMEAYHCNQCKRIVTVFDV